MFDNLTPQDEKLLKGLKFLLRLLVLAIPLYLVLWLAIDLTAVQVSVAGQSAWLLQSLGWAASQQGTLVAVGPDNFTFNISPDCTGWKSELFLFALVLAVPGIAWRKRLFGIIIGWAVIWAGNLVRIVSTVYIEAYTNIQTAMLFHDVWWQFGLIALVLAVWLLWLKFIAGKPQY